MFRLGSVHLMAAIAAAIAAFLPASAFAADCQTKVPADALLEAGKVQVSINPVSPPMQYVEADGTLKGMRVDLGDEIIKRLCLKSEHIRVDDFGTMIPGLQAGRWDIINTGVFFTEARAKVIYMVRYEYEAISIVARPGESDKIKSIDDLSGKTVGVDIGGYEENKLKEHDAALKAKGLPGINIQIFNDTNITYQALRAGQVDAVFTIDAVSKEYADRDIAAVALHGLDPSPVAICFRNKALAQAFADVLTAMRGDGSYQALFDKYGKKQWTDPFDVKGPDI
jgi:polar amino acid transport system substrate-binding protein